MKSVTDYPFSEQLLKSEAFFWNCRTPEQLAAYHKKLKRRTEGDNDYASLLSITQNNRKLFSLISSVAETTDGWTSQAKASALAAIVLTMKPAMAIEIGVWAGKGLLPIAFAMREVGGGIVTGIDPSSVSTAYSAPRSASVSLIGSVVTRSLLTRAIALCGVTDTWT